MSNKIKECATTVLLCGIGGQGTILAADLLAKTAVKSGYEVKLSEVHGMSQRGGSVTTTVRFGKVVHTMITDPQSADVIVSFETIEALRNLHFLKEGGGLVVNTLTRQPLPTILGFAEKVANPEQQLLELGALLVDADDIALKAGNIRTANVALLGALSNHLDFDVNDWKHVIKNRVPPKTVDTNLKAFDLGRQATITR